MSKENKHQDLCCRKIWELKRSSDVIIPVIYKRVETNIYGENFRRKITVWEENYFL